MSLLYRLAAGFAIWGAISYSWTRPDYDRTALWLIVAFLVLILAELTDLRSKR